MRTTLKEQGTYTISIDTEDNLFHVHQKPDEHRNPIEIGSAITFQKAEALLKRHIKASKKTPLRGFVRVGWSSDGELKSGRITSAKVDPSSYGESISMWFVRDDNERSKESISGVFKVTEENKKIIQQLKQLRAEIDKLETQQSELRNTLIAYSKQEIKEYFEL